MKKFALILVAVLLMVSTGAWAQQPVPVVVETPYNPYAPGGYVAFQLGAYGPNDGKYENYAFDTGVAGNLVFGYRLDKHIRLQGEFGYFDSESALMEREFFSMPLTVTGIWGMPIGNFEPYFLGGAGAYFFKVEEQTAVTDGVCAGGYLGMGADYHWGRITFGAQLRYLMTGVIEAPNDGLLAFGLVSYSY